MSRRIAITQQSVWSFTHDNDFGPGLPAVDYVRGRSTFGDYHPEQPYEGLVDGLIEVGKQFTLNNVDGGFTRSGTVQRIVICDDLPEREVPEGYIDITPSWRGLMPLLVETRLDEELARVAKNADILVALKAMGRVTDADIEAALARADKA
jgi:hypothetical protein